jgi:hypothetical protein
MNPKRRKLLGTSIAASAVVLALAAAPMVGFGADHLDAPGLTPPSSRADADINDIYAFQGHNESHTVLVMSTHPAAGAIAPLEYATDVRYVLQIDRDGNARKDVTYRVLFKEPRDNGRQRYVIVRAANGDSKKVARGWTGSHTDIRGGGKAFVGLRSDPFFFDLAAFQGSVLGEDNNRAFCDGDETDFFADFNVNAIVLELPDRKVGGEVGIWGETWQRGSNDRIDRMGRPAINTVFNSGADKDAFNRTGPYWDRRDFGDNVVNVLKTFSALDSEGAYSNAEANGLADVLLPDVLTYDTSTDAAGPLNGRALADDVIDAELNIVTGGFPFAGRDGTGAITGDCVGPHSDYMNRFPYLGEPHS